MKKTGDLAILSIIAVLASDVLAPDHGKAQGIPYPPTPPVRASDEVDPKPGVGLKAIASNFDISLAVTSSTLPDYQPAPPSEMVGAFRFICGPGQLRYDDPIVYPGQPGKSHLHQFLGNTSTDANSTYATLRTKGDSTCNNTGKGVAANRSAYWMPAVLDGKGHVVVPDYFQDYYKRSPFEWPSARLNVDRKYVPGCKSAAARGVRCVGQPNGIRAIFGFNQLAGTQSAQPGWFKCKGGQWYQNKEGMTPMNLTTCPVGSKVEIAIASLKCWNGQVDSSDHMAHMSRMVAGGCPKTHPYSVPQFTLSAFFTVLPGDDPALWSLSCDSMFPALNRGACLHFDLFDAWDEDVKKGMTACFDDYRNSSAGVLCDGRRLIGADIRTVQRIGKTIEKRPPVPVNPHAVHEKAKR